MAFFDLSAFAAVRLNFTVHVSDCFIKTVSVESVGLESSASPAPGSLHLVIPKPNALTPRAPEALAPALIFTFVAHAAAMLGMVACLLPGMPGGTASTAAARINYVADHAMLWHLGWFGWQLTALSDLLLSIALLRTRWISKPAAAATLVVTIAAILPDQIGQALWSFHGPAMARTALDQGNPAMYLSAESKLFRAVAGWGGCGYLVGAFGWTWCLAAAGAWSRLLTWLSVATWSLFAASVGIIFIPQSMHVPPWLSTAVSGANAIAFVLLLVWFAEAFRQVRRFRSQAAGMPAG